MKSKIKKVSITKDAGTKYCSVDPEQENRIMITMMMVMIRCIAYQKVKLMNCDVV
jgi:hypothetical protein